MIENPCPGCDARDRIMAELARRIDDLEGRSPKTQETDDKRPDDKQAPAAQR